MTKWQLHVSHASWFMSNQEAAFIFINTTGKALQRCSYAHESGTSLFHVWAVLFLYISYTAFFAGLGSAVRWTGDWPAGRGVELSIWELQAEQRRRTHPSVTVSVTRQVPGFKRCW